MNSNLHPSVQRSNPRHWITLLLVAVAVMAGVVGRPSSPASAAPAQAKIEAESMSLTAGAGSKVGDEAASGGAALLVWSNGTASGSFDVRKPAPALAISARADRCEGGAQMRVTVDGAFVAVVPVDSATWGTHIVPVAIAKGRREVTISFTNDHVSSSCDRNLVLDYVTTSSSATTTTSTTSTTTTSTTTTSTTTTVPADVGTDTDPLAGEVLHVSWSPATAAADRIRSTNPQDAARLDLIAETPAARWFGEWSGNISIAADGYVREAADAGALPVLVTYMIPGRDCGSYSAGGAGGSDAYRAWIRDLAAGIGTREAVVILEPDAVASADCLSDTGEADRYALIADAVDVLAMSPATTVYVDAGHAAWLPVEELAPRLAKAGVDDARGVSLNVSNFGTTQDQVVYATALTDRLGVHAVIDSSRNGNGSDGTWCNPSGRAIGDRPTTDPALPSVIDAVLWVKVPGESDGTCNGGPPAGEFWADYAIDLVRSAGY